MHAGLEAAPCTGTHATMRVQLMCRLHACSNPSLLSHDLQDLVVTCKATLQVKHVARHGSSQKTPATGERRCLTLCCPCRAAGISSLTQRLCSKKEVHVTGMPMKGRTSAEVAGQCQDWHWPGLPRRKQLHDVSLRAHASSSAPVLGAATGAAGQGMHALLGLSPAGPASIPTGPAQAGSPIVPARRFMSWRADV